MTKVVQLQIDPGSAGKQALRLHKAFLEAGIDSSVLSLHATKIKDERIKHLGRKPNLIASLDAKIQKYLTRKNKGKFGAFSYPVLGTDVSKIPIVREADIIYLHWVLGGFMNLSGMEKLARLKKPVVFYLHDMWSITGGCHHSFDCEKYVTGCNNCHMFPGNRVKDLSYKGFRKKQKLYSKYKNLYFVSPSKWLYECAKQSMLTKDKPVFHIPNLVDNTLYKAYDKKVAKQALNIPEDETVIAFGAVKITSPFKGWEYLQQALEILKKDGNNEKLTVLIFGGEFNKAIESAIPFKTRFIGYLNDDYSMSMVYNAADVFVAPSLADNLPTTIFESLSCGTPVVAFKVGGIPDLVSHKVNGYLANYRDARDFAEGIRFCLRMHVKGHILPSLEPSATIKKHLELFDYMQSFKSDN